jgi:hypothetical protein
MEIPLNLATAKFTKGETAKISGSLILKKMCPPLITTQLLGLLQHVFGKFINNDTHDMANTVGQNLSLDLSETMYIRWENVWTKLLKL